MGRGLEVAALVVGMGGRDARGV